MFSCSVADITKNGFNIYCNSKLGSSVTVHWMAIGISKTRSFAYKIYENFATLDNVELMSGAYDKEKAKLFY